MAIGTRSANQNPESRSICRGVPIEARPYEYSMSFPDDLIRDTAHAQRQFRHDRQCVHELESLGTKKE